MKVKVIGLALAVGLFMVGCDQQVSQPSAAVDQHNAQNSLDWPGSYTGILPCADCSGIETILDIKADGNYTLDETYQGKKMDILYQRVSLNGIKRVILFYWNRQMVKMIVVTLLGKTDYSV